MLIEKKKIPLVGQVDFSGFPGVSEALIPQVPGLSSFALLQAPFIIHRGKGFLTFASGGFVLPGSPQYLAVAAISGEVVMCDEAGLVHVFTNSSLFQFARALELFLSGLPYNMSDEEGHEFDHVDAAEEEIRAQYAQWDPPSVESNSFWDGVLEGIRDGDWDVSSIGE